jgi:hypothetical protein
MNPHEGLTGREGGEKRLPYRSIGQSKLERRPVEGQSAISTRKIMCLEATLHSKLRLRSRHRPSVGFVLHPKGGERIPWQETAATFRIFSIPPDLIAVQMTGIDNQQVLDQALEEVRTLNCQDF